MSAKNQNTNAIRTQTQQTQQREHATPLFMTSSFVFDSAEHAQDLFSGDADGNIYSRYSNPNTDEFISKMCALEETEAGIATSSGMSAVFSSMAALMQQGDHILVSRSLFGSTHQILTNIFPKWGILHTYVDVDKPETWEQNIRPETKMIFAETPSNPGLDIIDLEWLGKLAKSHNLILNIDNCFATPILQKPALFGADIIVHSATKFIDGQGRGLGGAILGSAEIIEKIQGFTRHSGPAMSPFNAWMFSKSLETLSVRMERHCENAEFLARELSNEKRITMVKYPGLPTHPQYELAKKQMKRGGGILTIDLGSIAAAMKFINNLEMISRSANLGDTRSIATHPATTTHSKLSDEERNQVNITPGLVRISAGLEDAQDILDDILQALG